jgi:hypothetical protein
MADYPENIFEKLGEDYPAIGDPLRALIHTSILDKEDSVALYLRFIDGNTYKEAGETLDRSESQARRDVERALGKMAGEQARWYLGKLSEGITPTDEELAEQGIALIPPAAEGQPVDEGEAGGITTDAGEDILGEDGPADEEPEPSDDGEGAPGEGEGFVADAPAEDDGEPEGEPEQQEPDGQEPAGQEPTEAEEGREAPNNEDEGPLEDDAPEDAQAEPVDEGPGDTMVEGEDAPAEPGNKEAKPSKKRPAKPKGDANGGNSQSPVARRRAAAREAKRKRDDAAKLLRGLFGG